MPPQHLNHLAPTGSNNQTGNILPGIELSHKGIQLTTFGNAAGMIYTPH
jgi:hypothetical protein